MQDNKKYVERAVCSIPGEGAIGRDGWRAGDNSGYFIMSLPKQRLIWLPNVTNMDAWVLLGVLACQHASGVEVEQP